MDMEQGDSLASYKAQRIEQDRRRICAMTATDQRIRALEMALQFEVAAHKASVRRIAELEAAARPAPRPEGYRRMTIEFRRLDLVCDYDDTEDGPMLYAAYVGPSHVTDLLSEDDIEAIEAAMATELDALAQDARDSALEDQAEATRFAA